MTGGTCREFLVAARVGCLPVLQNVELGCHVTHFGQPIAGEACRSAHGKTDEIHYLGAPKKDGRAAESGLVDIGQYCATKRVRHLIEERL